MSNLTNVETIRERLAHNESCQATLKAESGPKSQIDTSSSTSPQLTNQVIKSPRAVVFLFTILAPLTAGAWMLAQAAALGPNNAPPLLPFGLIAIAVLGLILAQNDNLKIDWSWRISVFVAAWILTAYVLYRLPTMSNEANYTNVTIAWALAIGFYTVAIAPPQLERLRTWRVHWTTLWAEQRTPILLLLGIVLLALVLRVSFLAEIPYTLGGDESSQGLEAIRVIRGEIRSPFTTGWFGVPTMSFFFNSLSIQFMGATKTALRILWALVGTATVLATFFLVKQLKGPTLGFATAALVATYHYHIHYSRLGSNQIADTLFVALAVLFLYRALDRRQSIDWILTGGVSALSLYFYAGARFTSLVVAGIIAYTFIRAPRSFWKTHRLGLLIALGAFLVVGAPMIQFALRFPDQFNTRLNQVGIFQSGWLENEVVVTGRSTTTILFDQFRRAALAFNFYPDRRVWYGLSQPLLDPFFGALFLLGLGYATLRIFGRGEDQRLAPMVAWWWGGVILGGMLTESPPSSQRLITLSVPVCFFIALALWRLLRLASEALDDLPTNVIMAMGVLVFSFISLRTYFLDYTPQRIYGGSHAELSTDLAPMLNELADSHDVYFLGAPWMFWDFPTLPYLAPDVAGRDIVEPLQTPPQPDLIPRGRGGIFIFLPARMDEVELVQQTFPGGELKEIRSGGTEGRVLGTIYRVPPTR